MKKTGQSFRSRIRSGQALVEYALILVLVAILFGVTLAATGPAIGNVFSNMVYNLIGGRPEEVVDLAGPNGRGRDDAFWATVQWLLENPPEEQASFANTPLPPSATATEGPSPTASPITPSPLPSNTPTATASATPQDRGHVAPWIDRINNPEWWRVDSNVWLGSDQFFGEYYANETLSGDPAHTLWHGQLLGGDPKTQNWGGIDFNWPSGSGPIENGFTTNNYSVRWTRQIGFGWNQTDPQPMDVRFTITTGGGQAGARVWLYEAESASTPMSGCSGTSSGGPRYTGGSSQVFTSGCLVIDAWRDTAETLSVVRTLQPQTLYIVQVDFYKRSGDAIVKLGLDGTSTGNPADTSLVSGSPQCDWYRADTQRSNSTMFIWEEARVGEFPQNMVCYLELRGYVDFTTLTNPKLIFWDVWDLSNSNTQVWLEIGQYQTDWQSINWQQIPLRSGTTNYAWTRNIIDLAPYVSGFSQKRLAIRFAMSDNNGGARRRWYVDDIEVRDFGTRTFGICTGSINTCPSYWNLDDAEFVLGNANKGIDPQFVTTGRWTLTNTQAQGKLSFDSGKAIRSNEVGGGDRIHYVEFNGLIDVTGNIPDFDGDDGVPVLTFHQAYDVRAGTQLEIQWTRDTPDKEPDNWQTLEVLVSDPGSGGSATQGLQETTVLLDGVTGWDVSPFRLRFAQIVKPNAVENGGWWIDNILIHRFDKPRFSDYPFLDTAQGGMENWLAQGQWGQTAPGETNFTPNLFPGSGRAFADSPNGEYIQGSNASLILKHPIDLNFDSPENLDPEDDSNVQTAAAVRPVLSFWHWRDIRTTHSFHVEWSNNGGQSWNEIWRYRAQEANGFIADSQRQKAWEYIEIDLSDIQANVATNPSDPYDDDIILRFRLDARNSGGSGSRDGVYIDDIRVENYSETVHKLWDPDVNHPEYGSGDNRFFIDDIDTPSDYWNRWKLGGFTGVDYTQRTGLLSLHDSPADNGNSVNTPADTYNVATLNRIIDLRALSSTNNPTLYFWTRYRIGNQANIQVQIAPEDTGYRPTNGQGILPGSAFNYQRVAGWGNWEKRWERTADARVQTWFRAAVDLRPYVGKRIKIRFVYNNLQGNDRDGWYIDDVVVEQRSTTPIPLPFSDNAKSLGNWIAEGIWGLAPDQWRGSGGGPADIGNDFWTGVYYDCERHRGCEPCGTLNDYNNLLYTNYASRIKRPYDSSLDIQEFALEIDHDFGSNGRPVGGLLDPTWFDYYAARWERPITIPPPGADVTFITVSDDGVRLRYSGPGVPTNPYWNIIERWSFHGRTVDIKTVSFAAGTYQLTLEWFEHSGEAVIIASAGTNNFSFADSPKAGNSPTFPVVNSVPFGDSSLILKSPIDLTGTTLPIIEYWTRYKLGSGTASFEVSTNGGFDWTTNKLGSTDNGFTCPPSTQCNPVYEGEFWPDDPTVWQRRQHNLSPYRTYGLINLRFNLKTANTVSDGWYITDIQINP